MDHSGAAMFVYFHQHQPRSDHHHDQHHQSHQHPIPQLSTWSLLMMQILKLSQISLPLITAMSDVILSCHTSLQLVNLGTSFQCIMYTSQCSHQSIQTSQLHWVQPLKAPPYHSMVNNNESLNFFPASSALSFCANLNYPTFLVLISICKCCSKLQITKLFSDLVHRIQNSTANETKTWETNVFPPIDQFTTSRLLGPGR